MREREVLRFSFFLRGACVHPIYVFFFVRVSFRASGRRRHIWLKCRGRKTPAAPWCQTRSIDEIDRWVGRLCLGETLLPFFYSFLVDKLSRRIKTHSLIDIIVKFPFDWTLVLYVAHSLFNNNTVGLITWHIYTIDQEVFLLDWGSFDFLYWNVSEIGDCQVASSGLSISSLSSSSTIKRERKYWFRV